MEFIPCGERQRMIVGTDYVPFSFLTQRKVVLQLCIPVADFYADVRCYAPVELAVFVVQEQVRVAPFVFSVDKSVVILLHRAGTPM